MPAVFMSPQSTRAISPSQLIAVDALAALATGSKNTAVGSGALANSTGTKNLAIGFQAGGALIGNNNIYIGSAGVGTESQTMRLGVAQTRTFIAGIAGASVRGTTVEIDTSTGQLGVTSSSARHKRDITPMGDRSEKMLELRPVTFAYREDPQQVTRYGLIAKDVAQIYPELVTRTATGEVEAVRYQELVPMLVDELQKVHEDLRQALRRLERQHHELANLRALVGQAREAQAETPR
jgi:hypothetical protein